MNTAIVSDGLPFPDFARCLPAEDRESFSGLTHAEIRSWAVSRADEYRKFSLALLSVHNTIAPIHCLPFEILLKIFEQSWYGRSGFRLAHVCRQWRSILLRTPDLWVHAFRSWRIGLHDQCRGPGGYLDALLARSEPRTIVTTFDRFSEHLLPTISPHAGRIVHLDVKLRLDNDLLALWEALRSGLPCLKKLLVHTFIEPEYVHDEYRFWDCLSDIDILPGDALPVLETAEVPAAIFACLARESLRHVRLTNNSDESEPSRRLSPQEFYDGLSRCPNLVELHLFTKVVPHTRVARATCHDPARYRPERPFSIALPKLEKLSISDDDGTISWALSCLDYPSTTSIHLIEDCHGLCQRLLRKFFPVDSDDMVGAMVSTFDQVDINIIDCNGWTCSTVVCCADRGGVERLRVELGNQTPTDLVVVFRGRAHVTHLVLRNEGPGDMRGGHDVDLRAFPHLTHLEVAGSKARFALLKLDPGDDTDGSGPSSGELIFPALEELVVRLQFVPSTKCRGSLTRDAFEMAADTWCQECSATLLRVLAHRAARGMRLTRLEFEYIEPTWGHESEIPIHSPVLVRRAARGTRLTRPEFEDVELIESQRCEPGEVPHGGIESMLSPEWQVLFAPLSGLVDGPVIFAGPRFFKDP